MYNSKGIKNLVVGLISKILAFGLGVVIPRLVLVNLGSEANGLLSSVTSIMTYMSLLEAGVGTASLQALYKPCSCKDKQEINQILSATNHFYHRTGLIYFICIIILSLGYPAFVQSNIPKVDVFVVVFLTGITGVLTYLYQGKFKIFLTAEGKNYIVIGIVTVTNIVANITKASLLLLGFGIVSIQMSFCLLNVVQIFAYYKYVRRHYPWLNVNVKPNYDAISQRNAALIHQIAAMIFSNTDILVLTVFTSLKEVSVYSMYALIYGMVGAIAETLYESYRYAIGQSFHSNKEKFIQLFNTYEVFVLIISFSFFAICRQLINPFLELYTSGIHDIEYIDKYLPWLFAVFYILNNGRTSAITIINVSEQFENTKWRAILESFINVTVSLIAVKRFGIYGVLIGTVAALLYRTNDMIIYASKILERSCLISYRRWIINIIAFAVASLLYKGIRYVGTTYFQLATYALGLSGITFITFLVLNCIFDSKYIRYVVNVIMASLNSKRNRK